MSRTATRSISSFLLLALLGACAAEPTASEDVASATLHLASTPPSVACLVVGASLGDKSLEWKFTVGTSATLSLDDVPVGKVTFGASAYEATCDMVTAAATTEVANWVADPLVVNVLPGRDASIDLVVHPNTGNVDGDVSFQTPAVQIAAGDMTSYALLSNGQVWAWGRNDSGQMGNGSNTDNVKPARVLNLPAVSRVAASTKHACALAADKTVWCWRSNANGQLATGNTNNYVIPRAWALQKKREIMGALPTARRARGRPRRASCRAGDTR